MFLHNHTARACVQCAYSILSSNHITTIYLSLNGYMYRKLLNLYCWKETHTKIHQNITPSFFRHILLPSFNYLNKESEQKNHKIKNCECFHGCLPHTGRKLLISLDFFWINHLQHWQHVCLYKLKHYDHWKSGWWLSASCLAGEECVCYALFRAMQQLSQSGFTCRWREHASPQDLVLSNYAISGDFSPWSQWAFPVVGQS